MQGVSRGCGLWAEPVSPTPRFLLPPPQVLGGVSKSGSSAFQLPGLEMAFQWISCHVAWRRVEVGQLGSKWGSQTLWGHRVGPRFAGAPSAPAFLVGRERAEPSTARFSRLKREGEDRDPLCFLCQLPDFPPGIQAGLSGPGENAASLAVASSRMVAGTQDARQAEGGSLRRPERTAFSPPSSSRAHSHILAERLCLQLFWGQG